MLIYFLQTAKLKNCTCIEVEQLTNKNCIKNNAEKHAEHFNYRMTLQLSTLKDPNHHKRK